MFALSRRFGALADRYGPRLFMGAGPLIAAAGHPAPRSGSGMHVVVPPGPAPGLLVFSLGLSMTVAPLTATVLADADEADAGIASAVNNAVARVAGLIGVSVIGIVVAGTLVGDTFAANSESVRAFHQVIVICAALLAAGGVTGALGIANPRRHVNAEELRGRPARRRARARSGGGPHRRRLNRHIPPGRFSTPRKWRRSSCSCHLAASSDGVAAAW